VFFFAFCFYENQGWCVVHVSITLCFVLLFDLFNSQQTYIYPQQSATHTHHVLSTVIMNRTESCGEDTWRNRTGTKDPSFNIIINTHTQNE
jgi:hypothetical protein